MMSHYFFYLDEYFTEPNKDNNQVWDNIYENLCERFGRPTAPGMFHLGRWSPSLTNYRQGIPRGVYFSDPEDATAFVLMYNKAIQRTGR